MTELPRCPDCGATLDAGASPEGLCPECLLKLGLSGGQPQEATETLQSLDSTTRKIGPYRLLQKIGEGGMGEVWEAEQRDPVRRKVALKLIKAGMDTRQVEARFESERQALALMDHPAIAKVFDAGATETGSPYFVMEYVSGLPITEYCDTERLNTKDRLELFIQVCEGVQHAHQKGIIHRDIKPSNVLVHLRDGIPVPKIIDFGVAKATQQKLTEKTLFTQLGVLVGTPAYMSPEQADLTGLDVDTRTDVYSLGVLLYELLVGALPFEPRELREAGFDEIRRMIREREPSKPSKRLSTLDGERSTQSARRRRTDPRSLSRDLRGDLDWITMRALEKNRARRYGSPADLAEDIRRHLSHEPVVAGPPSATYKAGRFVRRHRLGVSAAVVMLVALVLGTIGTTVGMVRARAEARRSEAKTLLALGGNLLEEHPTAALAYAVASLELVDDPEARKFALRTLWRGPTAFSERTEQDALSLNFSPDGDWLAGGGWHGMVKLWRRDGSETRTLAGHGDELVWVDFSSDSKFLVSGSKSTILVRELPEAEVVRRFDLSPWRAFVRGRHLLTFTGSGKDRNFLVERWPLAAGAAERLGVWTAPEWRLEQDLFAVLQGTILCDVDSRGKRLIYAQGSDVYMLPLDGLETETPRRIISCGANIVTAMFHPDGERVATLDTSSVIQLWSMNSDSPGPVRAFHHLPKLESKRDVPRHILRFDHRGSLMVSVNFQDRTTYVWDLSAPRGTEPIVLKRGRLHTFGLAVHPSGEWVAVADIFTVSIWPLSHDYSQILTRATDRIVSVAFDNRGERLFASSFDGTIRTWSTGGEDREAGGILFDAGDVMVLHLCVSPDGNAVAAGLWDGRVVVVPVSGGPVKELSGFGTALWAVTFDRTGRRVAAGGGEKSKQDAVIRIWDLETDEVQVLDAGDGTMIDGLEFMADGRLLAYARDGLRLWDIDNETYETLVQGDIAWSSGLSPDGRYILGSRFDEVEGPAETFLFDLQKRDDRILDRHGDSTFSVAWHPSGRQILAGDRDGVIRFGSVTGAEPHLLFGHTGFVGGVDFHPDGGKFASAGLDGTVRLWPTPEGQPFHTLPYEEFLERLHLLTNYRILADGEAATGYRIEYGPFPGWKVSPAW